MTRPSPGIGAGRTLARPLLDGTATVRRLAPLLAFALTALALRAEPVEACGFMAYSDRSEAEQPALEALLIGERLPLLSPGWHSEYWVIAWARLEGKTFDDAERRAFVEDPAWLRLQPSHALQPAIERWMAARTAQGAGGPAPSPWRRTAQYDHHLVCGPDAFLTAAATLRDRARRLPPEEVRAWIDGQDRVFARCSDPQAPLPSTLPSTATQRLRFDRAYQVAAATAYGDTPGAAEPLFAAIAESSSPWADIARYRVALLQVRAGNGDPRDLRERLVRTRDPKARRGLVQLLDRVTLFGRPPARIVAILSRRLVEESLGGDVPRVLRDIVHFAKRVPPDECVGGLEAVITGLEPCEGEDHVLARLRAAGRDAATRPPTLRGPLLEINRRFHAARRALAEGRIAIARRESAALVRLAGDSNAATRNAAATLALATARSHAEALRHAFRWNIAHPDRPTVLHRDGRRAVARLSMAQWRELMGRATPELEDRLAREGLIRATLLGEMGEARRFARAITGSAPTEDELASGLRAAASLRDEELRFALVMLLLEHDPLDLSISDELEDHWASSQAYGCAFARCGDDHPNQSPLSVVAGGTEPRASAERRRLEHAGPRIDALGDLVLLLAQAHPTDPRTPEMLHRFVRRTGRASLHRGTDPRTGALSRRAFVVLHQRFPDDPWTARTHYWYR